MLTESQIRDEIELLKEKIKIIYWQLILSSIILFSFPYNAIWKRIYHKKMKWGWLSNC